MDAKTTQKFLASIRLDSHDQVALLSAQNSYLARQLAAKAESLHVFDLDFTTLREFSISVETASSIHVYDSVFPPPEMIFEKAIIVSPKGRDYARMLLWSAYCSLKPGGLLYLLGANAEGIQSVITDAGRLFGTANTLVHKNRHRLGVAVKSAQNAPPAEWNDLTTEPQPRLIQTPLGDIQIATMPGVFSWKNLDQGTTFLLAQAEVRKAATGADVLDMGCGTGIIGCLLAPIARSVHMVDSNLLAVQCARTSTEINHLENVSVSPSDVYSAIGETRFDLIISNPPFHQGFDTSREITQRIIAGASDALKPGGQLILVANGFLPYEALMQERLSGVRSLAEDTQFKVLIGHKP